MWELTLNFSQDKSHFMDFLYSKLEGQVKFCGGVIIRSSRAGRVKIGLAVPRKQKDYFVLLLLELVSEVITQDFKFEYLNTNLGTIIPNELTRAAFIRALTVFDKQTDKDLIKKQLVFENELNIDSFFYFKLGELTQRWQEICVLVRENISALQASGSLAGLLKFLIKTSDIGYDEVHIIKRKGRFVLTDKSSRPIHALFEMCDNKSQADTIGDLILLSPSKIVLHRATTREPFFDFIENLFEDKVCII